MAFPSVRSATTTNGTTGTASPVINLPATIQQGDTIFVAFRCAVAGAVGWPNASWNELKDESADAADDQNACAWKRAEGTEGGTTITLSSGNGRFCALAIAVQDAADPLILAPEISTATTGTTPNEPDAGTVTPTGGAKDYLWYTFFGMEGEQTGITAYPGSFTLNQSGLANSGSAGAVTGNVTMAGAGRQQNAASQDAGVWDVTGTLDDWSAYTVAFHPPPADPVPGLMRAPAPRVVSRMAIAAACVFAFVPLVQAAPASADAATQVGGGQLFRTPTVHYTAVAGPVLIPTQDVTLGWLPPGLEPIRPHARIESVIVTPSVETVSAAQDVTWWPKFPDRLVSRIRFVAPFTADAPIAAVLPNTADALSSATGPMIWPRGTVQYIAIAGPVVVPPVVVPDRPLSFNDDGLIRPDRWSHHIAIAGPVAIPLETGWWTEPGRVVRRAVLPLGHVKAIPISPLNPDGQSDLPWLMPSLPLVRRIPQTTAVVVMPATVPAAGVPTMVWLPPNLPAVLAQYPTRQVLVVPAAVPASALSNLPWLYVPQPLILAKPPTRHQLSMPATAPAVSIDLPWLRPVLPLIQQLYPTRSDMVMPASVPASFLSNLPWLPSPPQLYRAKRDLPSFIAQVLLDNYGPDAMPDVIILVRPDVGIILVLPDIGDVEA